jgi:sarcosine oxidase
MGSTSSEVCVVGGGVIGLAAAAKLRDRGIDVVCFERAEEPGQGQSAGRTRQFRHLHAEPHLIELAVSAREGWRQWEQQFETTLLGIEGALRAGAGPGELDALRAAGVPAQELDPGPAHERFPVAALPPARLLWDPRAGALRADATIRALASHIGAGARHRTEVDSIAIRGDDEVAVITESGVHHCQHAVVCAGAGTDRLVRPLGIPIHQERQAHLRLSFRTTSPAPHPLPCFSDRTESAGEVVYALSDLEDRYAVGLAEVTTYPAVADLATDVPEAIDLAAQRERIIAYVRRILPGLHPEPVDQVLRLTTTVPEYPDDGFGIWRQGPVTAVAGPNLFKFAPVIGEQLATIATASPTAVSTAPGTPRAPSR